MHLAFGMMLRIQTATSDVFTDDVSFRTSAKITAMVDIGGAKLPCRAKGVRDSVLRGKCKRPP
ncbi:hypothetical protein ATN84_22745 [Paramesorhizobium deserti]|uniref:Uncharacterized protein n=1 Tax=Paramesorhizobium deserti TaxID=1494590 RepID=A0A135HNK3_9HYPH|nr:hypothetical protein ATN84_22745 [Paramesorhizobium deserti]